VLGLPPRSGGTAEAAGGERLGPAPGASVGRSGPRRVASGIATLLDLTTLTQRIAAAGVPPIQEIRFIGIEDTAATVPAAHPLQQGGRAEIAKHRTLADAQMGGNSMARSPLLTQRPHLLMALYSARPALSRLLLPGRRRGWNGGSHGAVR
jgi:hypothetical protein